MFWKPLIAAVLLTLSVPAFADEKGDALVQGWIAQLPDLLPITAETTTTYKIGKWTAAHKNKVTLAPNSSWSFSKPCQFDDECPMEFFYHPLGNNFDPLPHNGAAERLGIGPTEKLSHTRYLGKETISGTTYDVVEVRENLIFQSPMLVSLLRKEDNRISIKWYLDPEGIVRRMTFTGEVHLPNPYISIGSRFDTPATTAADKPQKPPVTPPAAQPGTTETFTATMVVDSMRKTREPVMRAGLSNPLYTVPESGHSNCVFSPDGKLLAIGRQDKLQVIQTSTGLPEYRLPGVKDLSRMSFSHDGKTFAFADAAGVRVLRTEDGALIQTLATSQRYLNAICLTPDGKQIALVTERLEVEIWSVETGLLERTLKDSHRAIEAIFSADGKQLVTAGMNTDIRIWDTSTWQIVERLPLRTLSREPMALSQDGKQLATVNVDNDVLLWDRSCSAPMKKLKGASGHIQYLTFSADGKSLYAGDSDELSDVPTGAPGYVCWDIASGLITADRSPWRTDIMSGVQHGVVSPDGRFAAFPGSPSSSGSVAVFSLQAGK